MRIRRRSWTLVLGLLLAMSTPLAAQTPVVRAVLFYSPTCPHCHKVITEDLPPLVQRYGDRLMIVGVDIITQNGQMLFRDAIQHYGIPELQAGVPLMVVDDQVLMGDEAIPQRLPGIIEAGLARGGTDWPELPLLREALVAQGLIKDSGSNAASAAASSNGAGPPAAENPAAETPATQPAPAEKPAAETPATQPAAVEKPASEPSAATQPSATQAPAAASPTPAAGASPSNPGAAETAAASKAPASATSPEEAATRPAGGAAAVPSKPSSSSAQEGISTGLEGAVTASDLSMGQRFAMDPLGNSVALVILLLMIGVVTSALSMVRRRRARFGSGPAWWIPVLALAGLGIALYLSFIEVSGAEAVCGPVGDCNTVQQSPYAHLLGVPVGVLGALGYVAIGLLWALAVRGRGVWRERGVAGLWAASFTGVLFSIYLTFLEPFVIGATCMWCVGSAVVMTLLLVASTGLLLQAEQTAPGEVASQPPALV
jgi:uncharacterized membrane protein/thiol-disulfide isomerase/thioredoxin